MKKIVLWLLIIILLVAIGFYAYRPKANIETPTDSASTYFYNQMIARGIEDIGQPIEGFDDQLLIMAFPGLTPADFVGVETFEGKYELVDGEVVFVRETEQPISSAERTVSEEGYATLLGNVSYRLALPVETEAQVDSLIETIDASEEIETKIGQGASLAGITITPTQLLEDSRCPANVNCIQAGTVRLGASVDGVPGVSAYIFELDKGALFGNKEVILVNVLPQADSVREYDPSAYSFYFRIVAR